MAESTHEARSALHPSELFGHVQDAEYFHLPRALGGHVHLPQPLKTEEPIFTVRTGFPPLDQMFQPLDLALTKFMVLEVVAAILIGFFFIRLANKMTQGGPPRGKGWNTLEAMLLFIRDKVAKPAIGEHDADRFVPFLWTLFFFVLFCNLLGMFPWMGSPTGSLATTGALALISLCTVLGAGMKKLGPVGFWRAQVPHVDLPKVMAIFLLPMIFVIEVIGIFIKHFVLAVRLLANMIAGHIVLAVIIAFISTSAVSVAWWGVAPASVLGAVALSLLELFVAFLQAYIFVFLSALFIGMAVHPH